MTTLAELLDIWNRLATTFHATFRPATITQLNVTCLFRLNFALITFYSIDFFQKFAARFAERLYSRDYNFKPHLQTKIWR